MRLKEGALERLARFRRSGEPRCALRVELLNLRSVQAGQPDLHREPVRLLQIAEVAVALGKGRQQGAVEKWQGLAKEVPEIAAQLQKLTRDYDVTKKAYDELLNRRESAKIGSDLQTQTQTVQFRVVDPPAAPLKPVAPKRPLLLAVVLIGGLIAGGAFAFLLTQIDDSILTVRQL